MSKKTVRWSGSNECIPISPIYSPASSSSSSSPSPPQSDSIVSERLRFKANSVPDFVYDLLYDPTEGHMTGIRLDKELLDQPATKLSIPELRVECSRVPYIMPVRESRSGEGVSVRDLFEQLHRSLQKSITPEFWKQASLEVEKGLSEACKRRCDKLLERNIALAVEAESAGPRRIDFIEGFTIFAGLDDLGYEEKKSKDPDEIPAYKLRLHVRQG
ncbi:hypothetical protein FB446DRAFT_754411 [Lentinula raphanica]|nr:hypothetical protein FB446DRAFT_754411 [Lentinula raphanica]